MDFSINIKRKAWIGDPKQRWNAGLESASLAWTASLQRYPPYPPNYTYIRTRTLGNKARGEVSNFGVQLDLFGVQYTPYVLLGTKYWPGWVGKLDETKENLKRAFIQGIQKEPE